MSVKRLSGYLGPLLVAGLLAGGCGSSSGNATSESQAAASGDIPDSQVFLTFHDRPAGYAIRYPEGWARKGSANDVTFRNRASFIRIVVAPKGSAPDLAGGKRSGVAIERHRYPHGGKVAFVDLATPKGVDNVDAYRMISQSFRWR